MLLLAKYGPSTILNQCVSGDRMIRIWRHGYLLLVFYGHALYITTVTHISFIFVLVTVSIALGFYFRYPLPYHLFYLYKLCTSSL